MKTIIAVAVFCILATVSAVKLDKPSSYIINGEDVSDVVTYYGYLEIFDSLNLQGNMFFGGSTLISASAVVTVALNVAGFSSWRVGLGGYRIQDLDWYTIATSHVHPEYNPNTFANNIAVLRLDRTITISNRIIPITRLPDFLDLPQNSDITDIVGFGFGATDNQPNILQQAQLTVLSQEACGIAYPHLIASDQLNNHFCANNITAGSNICAGDQGGPIVGRNIALLLGLQSFNRLADCSLDGSQPAAFIRVNRYTQFINSIVDNM